MFNNKENNVVLVFLFFISFILSTSTAFSGDLLWGSSGAPLNGENLTFTAITSTAGGSATFDSGDLTHVGSSFNVMVDVDMAVINNDGGGNPALFGGLPNIGFNYFFAVACETGTCRNNTPANQEPQGNEEGYIAMGLNANTNSCGEGLSLTLTFDPPVAGLTFPLLDVDRSAWRDVIRISATDELGNPVAATSPSRGSLVSGGASGITDTSQDGAMCNGTNIGCSVNTPCWHAPTNSSSAFGNQTTGNLNLAFGNNNFIRTVTIEYFAGNDESNASQLIALGDISWQDATIVPVTVQSFESSYKDGSLRVDYTTASESYNVGFNLYGLTDSNNKIKLNEELIVTQDGDSFVSQHYTVLLPGYLPESISSLVLEAIDIQGVVEYHGPYNIGASYGNHVDPEPINWISAKEQCDYSMLQNDYELIDGTWRKKNSQSLFSRALTALKLSSGNDVCHVEVSSEGMHRVTAQQLIDAGCDFTGQKVRNIAVTEKNEPVSRRVKGSKGKFAADSYIDFYATLPSGEDSLYISKKIYQVQLGKGFVNKHKNHKEKAAAIDTTTYLKTIKIAPQNKYAATVPSGDPFYDATIHAISSPIKYPVNINIDDPLSSTTGTLRVSLAGGNDPQGVTPDHHFKLYVNDNQVGASNGYYITGIAASEIQIGGVSLKQGTNKVEVEVVGDTGAIDIMTRESTEITFETELVTTNDEIAFKSSGKNIEVKGFSSKQVQVYGQKNNKLYKINSKKKKDGDTYKIRFKGIGNDIQYWVSTQSNLLQANVYGYNDPADLLTGSADLLIIAHPSLMGTDLDTFVSAKQSDGYSTKVVDVFDIYEKYGYGMHLPQAIADYIKEAELALGLSHVLLVGGGTYDYHGYLDPNIINLIPTIYRHTNDIIYYTPCDGCFVDTVGDDDIADISIGRFPARTAADLGNMISKSLETPGSKAILVAAVVDGGGLNFKAQLQGIKSEVETGFTTVSEIYADDIGGDSAAGTQMINEVNAGDIGTVIYSGHGSVTGWSNVFKHNDVSKLEQTMGVMPLSCYTSFYQTTGSNTMAHQLMSSVEGARYISGASVLSSYLQNGIFANSIMQKLNDGQTIGEAIKNTKQEHDGLTDQAINWTLLGDPTGGY